MNDRHIIDTGESASAKEYRARWLAEQASVRGTSEVAAPSGALAVAKGWGSAHRPTVVCLCGSTRFSAAFREANLRETIAGRIVLTIGCDTKSDTDLLALGELTAEAKARLDELHKRKIDLADEILVLNVGGYVGDSTRSEIDYAKQFAKRVRWLEEPIPATDLADMRDAGVLAPPAVATESPNKVDGTK